MSVDETTTSPEPFEYVEPIFGDSPEGTHVWQRVPYNADDYGPVGDFATDFDHADPAYNPNAPAVWKQLRESGCPVAHSDRYGGMWVPITHDTVNEIAYDTENFTSRAVVVSVGRPGDLSLPAPIGGAPPITSDPPFHNMARRLLLPAFAPKKIEPWEPEIRLLCQRLLDDMGEITPGESIIDAAVQYAQHIPVNVTEDMIRLVVPYAAGGPTDVMARKIGAHIAGKTGQPVIIENKGGVGALSLLAEVEELLSPGDRGIVALRLQHEGLVGLLLLAL